jgi:parallel beta-helix repeat protein
MEALFHEGGSGMKKIFVFSAIALLGSIFASCSNPTSSVSSPTTPGVAPETTAPSEDGNTYIKFDNTQGLCAAVVYNDHQRRDGDRIAIVQAGEASHKIPWEANSSWPFYLSWQFAVPGAEENTIIYTPSSAGKNQVSVRIDSGKITTIPIPKLEDTLGSSSELLSGKSYIIIQNNAAYSFTFMRGLSQVKPENLGGAVVNAGEKALYTLEGGAAASVYTLLVGASSVNFPASPAQFAAGHVYRFVYNGSAVTAQGSTRLDVTTVTTQGTGGVDIPAVPSGLAVSGVTQDSVSLSWSAVNDASGYRIYRASSADGVFLQIGSRAASQSPSYTESGLTSGTTYYYKVSAVNAAGESVQSAMVEGKTSELPTAPAAPAALAVSGATTTSVALSWNAVSGASGYKIYRAPAADGTFAQVGTSETNAYTDAGLSVDTAYYYKVSAVNAIGESAHSAAVEGKTIGPPAAPAGLAVSGVTTTSVSLSWNAVSGASGYKVYRAPAADGTFAQVGTSETNAYTDAGLSVDTAYYYKVSAVNAAGESAQSAAVEGKTIGPPSAPAGLAVSGATTTSVSLSWNAVSGASGYKVYRAPAADGTFAQVGISETNAYTDAGLSANTTYYYKVSAVNAAGESARSAAAAGTTGLLTVTELDLSGAVTAPEKNVMPQTTAAALNHSQYAVSTLAWQTASGGAVSGTFAAGTVYKAVLGLQAHGAYTFAGLGADAFGFSGATSVTAAVTGQTATVTVIFPATQSEVALIAATADEFVTRLNWIKGNGVADTEYTITLSANISIGPQTMNAGASSMLRNTRVTIAGDGIERIITLNANGSLFTLEGLDSTNQFTFTLGENITLRGKSSNTASVVRVNQYAKFIMQSGTISGNTAASSSSSSYGGGVYVDSGTFTMSGGTISGNTASSSGGGVYMANGTFTMSGGTISGNTASSSSYYSSYGGGVYVDRGTFTMSGSSVIRDNTATTSISSASSTDSYSSGGGGVYVNRGTFTMSDGTISGNTASLTATTGTRFVRGAGVYAGNGFTMTGGIISGNTVSGSSGSTFAGGGVYVGGGRFIKSGNSIIYGNDAYDAALKNTVSGSNGHAVYVNSDGRRRNATAYASDTMDSNLSGYAGGWE